MPSDVAATRRRLQAHAQDHLLHFADDLSDDARAGLLKQIDALDLPALDRLIDLYVRAKPTPHAPASIDPVHAYNLDHTRNGAPWDRDRFRSLGQELIRAGKVAAFTVAGGQGTRLGFDGPKGVYQAGAVTSKPLFAFLAESVLATSRRYHAPIPWYIMTSPLNHAATVGFFESHNYLGLDRANVMFFPQGVLPTFEMGTGRILLAGRAELAVNPDGHGGSLRALRASGALADMRKRGVEHISYTQIDNPLVRVIDPVFLGLHAHADDSSGEMSSKMVAKANAREKVGVFCVADGKTQIIEYSDLPASLAEAVNADGRLRFNAGSIAVHILSCSFVERLTEGNAFALPYHRAEKKSPHVDVQSGRIVEPAAPNAVKLETFVFDAIPLAESSIVLETDRVEEFAPIKNADGADSPASCAAFQSERAARWLERAGVAVPRREDGSPECVLEISPLSALEPDDLRAIPSLPRAIEPGAHIAL